MGLSNGDELLMGGAAYKRVVWLTGSVSPKG